MTNNLIIPKTLLPIASILSDYLRPVVAWASQFIFQQLLTQNKRHPLIVIERILDFSSLEQACITFHETTAVRGRPVTHTVSRLLRAIFIKYWYDLSLRQLEERLRYDMLIRWFVGYGLHQEVAG